MSTADILFFPTECVPLNTKKSYNMIWLLRMCGSSVLKLTKALFTCSNQDYFELDWNAR